MATMLMSWTSPETMELVQPSTWAISPYLKSVELQDSCSNPFQEGEDDEGPSTLLPRSTPQVPTIDGPITRSKARKLHQELNKVIIYFIEAIHELANREGGTRATLEANLSIIGMAPAGKHPASAGREVALGLFAFPMAKPIGPHPAPAECVES